MPATAKIRRLTRNRYLRKAEYRNTDWFKELFRSTFMHTHSISITSGTEKSAYYASISALFDPGWTKTSEIARYTANLNATYNISDDLTLNLITSGSYRKQKAPGTLGRDDRLCNRRGEARFRHQPLFVCPEYFARARSEGVLCP